MAVDYERIARAALESLLDGDQRQQPERHERRLGGAGALAIGLGLALGARALYRRVREIDLEEAGAALEERLRG